jgi:dynein light chain 4
MGFYADVQAASLQAKYPLVKYTDMTAEVREEAVDICITAVEKYATDMEKCTQVGSGHCAACSLQSLLADRN